MVQVFPKLHVPVTPGSDVEIALDPIQIHAPKDAAAVAGAAQPRRLGPLGPLSTQPHDVVDVLLAETLLVALARDDLAVLVPVEPVGSLYVDPLGPRGGVALELGGGEDAVAGGVLDVDVQVGALHPHDRVQVDLHVVAHTLLDSERVLLGAAPPPRQLGPHEDEGDEDHGDGPFSAARGSGDILGF